MGFDKAWVDISCDECGLESEPEELALSPAGGGSYALEPVRVTLLRDGWTVKAGDRLLCQDCAFAIEDPVHTAA